MKARGAVAQTVDLYATEDGKSPYQEWIRKLRDIHARAIIRRRIDRVKMGNFGDHKGVGEGVYELIIDFGPGYRVYYALDGDTVVILLCGGAKKSQSIDIQKAKQYWADYRS